MKHIGKLRLLNKMFAIVMAVTVTLGCAPLMSVPAYAAEGDPAISPGAAVLEKNVNTSSAQVLHFGGYEWYTIAYDGKDGSGTIQYKNASEQDEDLYPEGTATMLMKTGKKEGNYKDGWTADNKYADSLLRKNADNTADAFAAAEKNAILERTLEAGPATACAGNEGADGYDQNKISGTDVEGAQLWPLSYAEAIAVSQDIRPFELDGWKDGWWLRSPGINKNQVSTVEGDGTVQKFGQNVSQQSYLDHRFAFYLDLSKVLFTSAATGGKDSDDEGPDALLMQTDKTNSGNEWKVTVADSAHEGFAVDANNVKYDSKEGTVTVPYSGAVTEDDNFISAIITDKAAGEENAKILYYGRIEPATSASGSVTINVTDKYNDGNVLYVFNEQVNGDKKTDGASALNEISLVEKFTVKFEDGQGNVLKTEIVESGKAATAPSDPERDGYTFKGWDKDFSNISSDLTVTAEWEKNADPKPAATSGTLLAKINASGKKSLILEWNSIKGADGYDVFFSKCGKNKKCKKVKTVKAEKALKWTKKGLKKKTAYKAYVKAYVMKDGKKKYIKKSPVVHAYTSGGTNKYTNAKSVIVKKKSVSLKSGKTYKIKASVTKLQKGKKLMSAFHGPKLRYMSSNTKVATVSKKGKITAKSKGKCKIYVFAINGVRKAVSVTVK